ncbi:hypothetical protein RND81_13G210800 [Saponaria officinalis]|uniref:VQ domain-containing protein n=1 Tax=Saponaria officinalis TaxID=3572 RepID=A0AAW1H4T1_SAPOF
MNPPQQPPTRRRENLIQGPRPTPLRVTKDSFKIKKPPKPPQHPPPQAASAPTMPVAGNQPVIIYSVSPKPYFVEASDFRSLVQHLTGRSTAAPESYHTGEPPVSPAARLAVMERTSPKEREWRRGAEAEMDMEMEMGGQMTGILSPAPENLAAVISPGMFTTAAETVAGEGHSYFAMNELMSPYMSNTAFLPSPSALLFSSNTPLISPSPSADFFNIFNF